MAYFDKLMTDFYKMLPMIIALILIKINYLYYNNPQELYDYHTWIKYILITFLTICFITYVKWKYDE
jgi:hypothetical protein